MRRLYIKEFTQSRVLIILALCFLFTGKTPAQSELPSISIFFPVFFDELPRGKYSVVLDRKGYSSNGGELYIDSITPGMHLLEIYVHRDDGKSRVVPRPFTAFEDSIYIPAGCDFVAVFGGVERIKLRNKLCYTDHGGCDVCYRKQEECTCGKYK